MNSAPIRMEAWLPHDQPECVVSGMTLDTSKTFFGNLA